MTAATDLPDHRRHRGTGSVLCPHHLAHLHCLHLCHRHDRFCGQLPHPARAGAAGRVPAGGRSPAGVERKARRQGGPGVPAGPGRHQQLCAGEPARPARYPAISGHRCPCGRHHGPQRDTGREAEGPEIPRGPDRGHHQHPDPVYGHRGAGSEPAAVPERADGRGRGAHLHPVGSELLWARWWHWPTLVPA